LKRGRWHTSRLRNRPREAALLPSFYISSEKAWNVRRAALCGAVIGLVAALFKALGPLHAATAMSRQGFAANVLVHGPEIVGVTFVFALLCAGAAALRNFAVRNLLR
jgi:hypothetical protein